MELLKELNQEKERGWKMNQSEKLYKNDKMRG